MQQYDENFNAHSKMQADLIEMKISDHESFFEFLAKYATPKSGTRRIFRGQNRIQHDLLPGIARPGLMTSSDKEFKEADEELLLRHFKERAHRFVEKGYDDLSLLVLAQHHGLPTRLLDWSYNPLVAAYMATEHDISHEENGAESSAIYVWEDYPKPQIGRKLCMQKIQKLQNVEVISPAHLDIRIVNQRGLFSLHPHPWTPFNSSKIVKVEILHDYRRDLRKLINVLGVNESVIYPGLDGLSKHLKWMQTNDW